MLDWPPPEPDELEVRFHRVASTSEIVAGSALIVRVGVKRIALFSVKGTLFALNNLCPHGGGNLGLGKVRGGMVTCPRHEWDFDIETGDCPDHEPYRASSYAIEIRDGEVYVGIPQETW